MDTSSVLSLLGAGVSGVVAIITAWTAYRKFSAENQDKRDLDYRTEIKELKEEIQHLRREIAELQATKFIELAELHKEFESYRVTAMNEKMALLDKLQEMKMKMS